MADEDLITSALRRMLRLGSLAGRVGSSMLGTEVANLTRSGASKQTHRTESLVRNARRVVETLGEMKGAAMKVGQMLSLHEGLLPPEVSEILRSLQREAPRVPAEVMEYEVRGQLKEFDRLFAALEAEGFAAASIGQVHRGRLRDGREVAVKIQYPLIDEIIRADLKNLKTVLRSLFSLFSNVDFDPVWCEVRDRLLEELDYRQEAETMRRMAALHADWPAVIIPRVIDEASTARVLTMELVEGIPPDAACSARYPAELRDRWGAVLFEFQLRGLYDHRWLHADPNLSNFAFREDGRVVVYDFGCVKRVPRPLARAYARLTLAAIEGRRAEIPRILHELGVHREDGAPLAVELTDPYLDLFRGIFREDPPYTFGEDETMYRKLIDLGLANWTEARDLRFPEDLVFVNRALSGNFGNLNRLRAAGPWRSLALKYTTAAAAEEAP